MQELFRLPRYVYLVVFLTATIYFIQGDRYFGYTLKEAKEPVNITSDGTAYFAYLPQYLIYPHQKPFKFAPDIVAKYPGKNLSSMLGYDPDSKRITNKFYVGTPILQLPFFSGAHFLIKILGKDADGYSRGYRLAIQLAALFWVSIGFLCLIYFLNSIGIAIKYATLSMLLIALGTNLNTYSVYIPSMSHVYSFSMINLFLFFSNQWIKLDRRRDLLLCFLILGFIAIIRPINLVILFILPFLFDEFQSFTSRLIRLFKRNYIDLMTGILILLSIVFIQVIIHYDLSGQWSLYTYSGEGFDNWCHPQFWNVLFSSQKGFFIYSPLLLLILPGLFYFFKNKSNYFTFGWLSLTLAVLYMISSWWDWAYGGGLGMRPLVEFLPLFVLPIAFLIQHASVKGKILAFSFSFLAIIQFQFFQFQFNQHILPYSEVTWNQLSEIKWKTASRFNWMYYYDKDTLPPRSELKIIGESVFDGSWKNKGLRSVSTNGLDMAIGKINRPLYGELNGQVKLYREESNPTILIDYFLNGEKVRSASQPLGNQIETLNLWTDVHLEFHTKQSPFDSLHLKLETYGQESGYRDIAIKWYSKD